MLRMSPLADAPNVKNPADMIHAHSTPARPNARETATLNRRSFDPPPPPPPPPDGATALQLDKGDWKELGCAGLKAAKVMGALVKLEAGAK